MFLFLLFLTGCIGGIAAAVVSIRLVGPDAASLGGGCESCRLTVPRVRDVIGRMGWGRCLQCQRRRSRWPWLVTILSGILFAFYGWMLVVQGCQTVTEVRPSAPLWVNRLPFQLAFIWLLLTVTLTDLLDYIIVDLAVIAGVLIATIGATVSGELQIIHVWVDWNYEMVELHGPYLPEWMKLHQHLHGLVWTLAGMSLGAGLMWLLRFLASTILGYPAVGLGDVTLMALIGAFLGWQPVLCVLALAPVAGLVVGTGIRLFRGRSFVAFGPYLTSAAFLVLCSWRYLWVDLKLRTLFGHGPTVIALIIGTLGAISVLLIVLRLYRALPTSAMRR